jgi:propanediol dehydratase medium subunit
MSLSESAIRRIIEEVIREVVGDNEDALRELGGQRKADVGAAFQLKETGTAGTGTRKDEVVVAVAPAFMVRQKKTIIGLPHDRVLKEIIAGIEEEGVRARLVKVYRTSDVSFIAHEAAKLSGSGIGIGIQSKGTVVIHQKDLLPLSNLDCSPRRGFRLRYLSPDREKRGEIRERGIPRSCADQKRPDGQAEISGHRSAAAHQRDGTCRPE